MGKNTFRVKFSSHGTSRALLYCIKCLLILEHRDLQEGKKFEIFIFEIAKAFNIAAVIKSKTMHTKSTIGLLLQLEADNLNLIHLLASTFELTPYQALT